MKKKTFLSRIQFEFDLSFFLSFFLYVCLPACLSFFSYKFIFVRKFDTKIRYENSIHFVSYRFPTWKIRSILYCIEFRTDKFGLHNIVSNFDMVDMHVLTTNALLVFLRGLIITTVIYCTKWV